MKLRRVVLKSTLAALCLGALFTPSAFAAPTWDLGIHHNPTHFEPGSVGNYWLDITNTGATASSGPITVTLRLPAGITRRTVRQNNDPFGIGQWSCPGSAGEKTVVCTSIAPITRYSLYRGLNIVVDIAADACGTATSCQRTAAATITGGGAPPAPPLAGCAPGVGACDSEPTQINSEPAGFGIVASSFEPSFLEADGLTPTLEAGAHPTSLAVPFDFNSVNRPTVNVADQSTSAGSVHEVTVDLPPGFVGNPTAVGECTQAQLTAGQCPLDSQVGVLHLRGYPVSSNVVQVFNAYDAEIFNLTHPRGVISDLGFQISGNPVHIQVSLDPANRYAIRSRVPNINETIPVFDQRATIWGIPADSSHDQARCGVDTAVFDPDAFCPTDHARTPFLTVPSQCEDDNVFRLHHYDSWQQIGAFGPQIDYTIQDVGTHEALRMNNCDRPRFEPDVEIVPTGKQANTPTGLDVHVKIAQNGNPNALGTPPVKRFTVRLPEGMSFSPSFADGLQSCTLSQMRLGTNDPVQCPDASRIGEVELHTPLLPKVVEGSMYLAAQGDNPFGSTFALLLVVHDTEERGVLLKIPGRIDVDEQTGQIVTVFNDSPQFPFEDLTLKFRSGPRAPLVSPPTCGKQTIGIEVASYAQPQNPVDASNTYEVTEGPNGTPCPPESSRRPFRPSFSGGTLNPVAGAYSPFLFRMTRQDDEQELSQVTTTLPRGLVAKIAGVSFCPEQAIASISQQLGTGRAELNNPACPAASQIGSVSAGLGAGTGPNYFDGKVFLAGPYKGAPLSLAVVAPALAGPYDLGNVVVRAALYVDPDTTQVRAVSDPFPTILHGVLLRVRDVRLRVDRPETTINPTSCERKEVRGEITGVGGSLLTTADDSLFMASTPFQVGSCSDLTFKPKLSLRLFGGTHRGSHPKFRATVQFPPGGANTAFASVALPRSEFLDQGHIGTVCTRVQFAAEACPQASVYGTVSAKTPLLDEELHGNIYLRSSNNKLPDVVAAFRGGRIDANLVGRVDSVRGGIRNTFDFVPDVPVTSATFSFFGGKKGLLVNSRNICKGTPKATAVFQGQNGDKLTLRPRMQAANCAKARKAQKRRARAKR
jgi:hypothetical protein